MNYTKNQSNILKAASLLLALFFTAGCITITTGEASQPAAQQQVVINPTAVLVTTVTPLELPPTQEPTMTPDPRIFPGEPQSVEGEVKDADTGGVAAQKRAISGDSYLDNFYERPFTQTSMEYLPDIDILGGVISSDTQFFYFTIVLTGTNAQTNTLIADYGVELDTDTDGRGEYSVWVSAPSSKTWSTDGVRVLRDGNGDIGGKNVYESDAPYQTTGYESTVDNTGLKAAWARLHPENDATVQIAVHRDLVGNPVEMLWGLWADNGLKNPGLFDYNDTYTLSQAGSPYSNYPQYPVKVVHSCDNTCRQPWGFNPTYRIPNICWSGGPVTTPEPTFRFRFPWIFKVYLVPPTVY